MPANQHFSSAMLQQEEKKITININEWLIAALCWRMPSNYRVLWAQEPQWKHVRAAPECKRRMGGQSGREELGCVLRPGSGPWRQRNLLETIIKTCGFITVQLLMWHNYIMRTFLRTTSGMFTGSLEKLGQEKQSKYHLTVEQGIRSQDGWMCPGQTHIKAGHS